MSQRHGRLAPDLLISLCRLRFAPLRSWSRKHRRAYRIGPELRPCAVTVVDDWIARTVFTRVCVSVRQRTDSGIALCITRLKPPRRDTDSCHHNHASIAALEFAARVSRLTVLGIAVGSARPSSASSGYGGGARFSRIARSS